MPFGHLDHSRRYPARSRFSRDSRYERATENTETRKPEPGSKGAIPAVTRRKALLGVTSEMVCRSRGVETRLARQRRI